MPTLPRTEAEFIALTQRVCDGLTTMAQDFPNPPVAVADIQALVAKYGTVLSAVTQAEMDSQAQHTAKAGVLKQIEDGVKSNLKWAEVTARKTPEKLTGLGWGPRRSKTPLQAPGEITKLTIVNEADTWLLLSWQSPADGGLPSAYRIQRQQGTGPWENAETATATQLVMSNQPRGVQLSYRVIAVNKAGESQPSGVVQAVL